MNKTGIICAADTELAPFLPHIQNRKTSERAMLKFHEGMINGLEVAAVFCGVGRTNAAIAAQILIDCYGVDMIINAGTAGGMDERLDIFDTVVATESVYHDVHEDILTGFHPWLDSVFFKSDEVLLELLRDIAAKHDKSKHKIYFGRMVTGEKFITDEGRDEINASFFPLSIDMETAGIAHVCYVNKIPFVAIRCITDTASHSGVENFEKNCATAAGISGEIVRELLAEINKFYIR